MNLNYLQTLLAVKQCGSFSAAARQIGLTQPAVSLQIQALEEELQAQLVVRNARTCELTPAGLAVADFAAQVFDRLQQTTTLVSQLAGEVSGPIRIGASTIPGEYILPAVMADFIHQHPKVKLCLEIGDSDQIIEWLDNKRIDIGVIGSLPDDLRLQSAPLAEDELLLTVPAGHPWSNRVIDPSELDKQPFVDRETGSGTRANYVAALRKLDVDVDRLATVFMGGSSSSVLTAVESGLGYAFCSRWALGNALALGRVAVAKVSGLSITRTFQLVTFPDRFRTLAAEELLAFLSRHGQSLQER